MVSLSSRTYDVRYILDWSRPDTYPVEGLDWGRVDWTS